LVGTTRVSPRGGLTEGAETVDCMTYSFRGVGQGIPGLGRQTWSPGILVTQW